MRVVHHRERGKGASILVLKDDLFIDKMLFVENASDKCFCENKPDAMMKKE